MICGAEGWVEIEAFGKAKQAWFTALLQLPKGIPSHDTFGRVFALIDPQPFEASLVQWVQGISTRVPGVSAIDGKTRRRSHDHAVGKQALQRVACLGSRKSLGPGAVRAQRRLQDEVSRATRYFSQFPRSEHVCRRGPQSLGD